MIQLVRKTLDIYLREKRVVSQSDFTPDAQTYFTKKDSVFVTLYFE